MYTPQAHETIEPIHEIEAILDYLKTRWDGFDTNDMPAFVQRVWDKGYGATPHSLPDYFMDKTLREWRHERVESPLWNKKEKELVRLYDAVYGFIEQLESVNHLHDIIRDNERHFDLAKEVLKTEKPEAPGKIKPKNWRTQLKTYQEKGEIAEGDYNEFKGASFGGAGGYSFELRTDASYVTYQHDRHGDKPVYILVSSILYHASQIRIHNNGAELLNEIQILREKYSQPEYFTTLQHSIEIDSTNRHIQALQFLNPLTVRTEAEIKELIAEHTKESKPLSKEEKHKIGQKNADYIAQRLESLFSGKTIQKTAEEVAQEKEQALAVMEILNSSGQDKKKLKP